MPKFIVISGPQSSGKTTIFSHLSKKYGNKKIRFIPEISPYTESGTDHPRLLSPYEIQENLTKKTLTLLENIDKNSDYVMETGPMQIVYIEKYTGIEKAENYFKKYLKIITPLKPVIVFVETKPEISFRRRKNKYVERIKRHGLLSKKEELLEQYEKKIYDLYPLWHKWLDKYPFEKIVVKNNYKTKKKFISEMEGIFRSLLSMD